MKSPHDLPVCMVTGGSSGIGLATCDVFRKNGYHVAFCGRDRTRLIEAERTLSEAAILAQDTHPQLLAVQADVGDPNQIDEFVERTFESFQRIDVLVNNAGMVPFGLLKDIPRDDFAQSLDVNIGGTFFTTQCVWPIMKRQGGGVIINISSLAAVDPFPGNGLTEPARRGSRRLRKR